MPTTPQPASSTAVDLRLLLTGVAFFVSGMSALIYQVAWQRILELHSGVGVYSVAMVVGAFMAGLGIGSHLGGVLSPGRGSSTALKIFGGVELCIALFGSISCWLYYDVLYLKASWLYTPAWRAGLLHFLGLLLPTSLMGMSLPFLARATVFDKATAGRTLGFLYGGNVLGASLGALITPWILIRLWGIRGSVLVAACGNAVAGLSAWAIGRLVADRHAPSIEPQPSGDSHREEEAGGRPLPLWLALYSLSGFCALSLEILWFRIVDVAVRSTAFTFGTVLAIYLLGSAVGSLTGAAWVKRVARPLAAFLTCQCLILIYSGTITVLLGYLAPDSVWLTPFSDTWRRLAFVDLVHEVPIGWILRMYLLFPICLLGPPTVLMGLSFPVLQRAVQDDPKTSGAKVGLLQAANIAGCIAGSLLVGLLLLRWLETAGTLRLLTALGLAFAFLGIWHYGVRSRFSVLGVALLGLLVAQPGQRGVWFRFHGGNVSRGLLAEDSSGVSAITGTGEGKWVIWNNGKRHSHVPFGGVHTQLGAIAAVVHPQPLDVAIVGLGSGDTAWAAACRPETRRVVVFEICGPNLRLIRQLAARGDGGEDLRFFLADARVQHVVADGRIALERSTDRYDVIEIDALWPTTAYAGNLYSVEFFRACSRKLKPGGIMVSWMPTERGLESFRAVFPRPLVFAGQIAVGGNHSISLRFRDWRRRLESVAAYFGPERSEAILTGLRNIQEIEPEPLRPERQNLDLFPRDEFLTPNP